MGRLSPEEEGTDAGQANEQMTDTHSMPGEALTLRASRTKTCWLLFGYLLAHGVSYTPSQFRHLLDLPLLFLHPEPEETISEHSKQKYLIEKKFGSMTEK